MSKFAEDYKNEGFVTFTSRSSINKGNKSKQYPMKSYFPFSQVFNSALRIIEKITCTPNLVSIKRTMSKLWSGHKRNG